MISVQEPNLITVQKWDRENWQKPMLNRTPGMFFFNMPATIRLLFSPLWINLIGKVPGKVIFQ